MSYRLTRPAARDIDVILEDTLRLFGPRQVKADADLIERGLALVGDDPVRPGSIHRPDLDTRVRFFHLALVAGRQGSAAHGIYYAATDKTEPAIILRLLHERMDPRGRITAALLGGGEKLDLTPPRGSGGAPRR